MDDAFSLLGLPDTATCTQVRQAYLKKAELLHPDKGGDAAAFTRVHAAYRYAMLTCTQPVMCTKCAGVGAIERVVGWRVGQIGCANCGGSGTVPRGGTI